MRLLLLLISAVGLLSFGLMNMQPQEEDASMASPEAWGITSDSQSGPILFYTQSDGEKLAQIDCVGSSMDFSLLDASRPFNLRLALRSHLAHAWTNGREVVVMMKQLQGWEKVDAIALLDDLIIDPEDTERGLVALQETGSLHLRIMANLNEEGISEHNIEITDNQYAAHALKQLKGCSRKF